MNCNLNLIYVNISIDILEPFLTSKNIFISHFLPCETSNKIFLLYSKGKTLAKTAAISKYVNTFNIYQYLFIRKYSFENCVSSNEIEALINMFI